MSRKIKTLLSKINLKEWKTITVGSVIVLILFSSIHFYFDIFKKTRLFLVSEVVFNHLVHPLSEPVLFSFYFFCIFATFYAWNIYNSPKGQFKPAEEDRSMVLKNFWRDVVTIFLVSCLSSAEREKVLFFLSHFGVAVNIADDPNLLRESDRTEKLLEATCNNSRSTEWETKNKSLREIISWLYKIFEDRRRYNYEKRILPFLLPLSENQVKTLFDASNRDAWIFVKNTYWVIHIITRQRDRESENNLNEVLSEIVAGVPVYLAEACKNYENACSREKQVMKYSLYDSSKKKLFVDAYLNKLEKKNKYLSALASFKTNEHEKGDLLKSKLGGLIRRN